MPRGRPNKSQIRQNIIEILYFKGKEYGYNIYKIYMEIFHPCTQKSIYYHLAKGVQTKEFKVSEIRTETGDFSWGSSVEKIYYELGPAANPKVLKEVKDYFDNKKY